ncbi:hypothetical protein BJ684DRAFT_8963, partial [Piptocephalis cylindrospora]
MYTDQFEWEVPYAKGAPERFAECVAMELGLPSTFPSLIAHGIREQADAYARALHDLDHPASG